MSDLPGVPSEAIRLERLHNAVHQLGELMQRYENRPSAEGRLPEQYIDGHINLLADIEAICERGQRERYAAGIRPANRPFADAEDVGFFPDDDEAVVFVLDVEVMEPTKVVIPSFVRLERPKYLDNIWSGPVYVSLFDSLLKVLSVSAEGETNPDGIAAATPHKIAGEKIEGGPEIVDGISEDGGPHGRWLAWDDVGRLITDTMTVRLYDRDVRIGFKPEPNLRFEVRDVMVGPLNL